MAFASDATNLVTDDTNGFSDIYVVNVLTGTLARVSVPHKANQGTLGTQANGGSFKPSISASGRYIAFESTATNLVSGGTAAGVTHVYLYDRDADGNGTFDETGNTATSTVLISQSSGGTQGNGNSIQAAVSGDGGYVAFASDATNLIGADANGVRDIFLRDVAGGTTILVSRSTGGTQGDGASRAPSINRNTGVSSGIGADGRHIAFVTTRWGRKQIAIIDRTGANVRRITEAGDNDYPNWQPITAR